MTDTHTNSEHRFDCLNMELEIVPTNEANRINLVLSILFGVHEEDLHYGSGRAKFGIKKGFLSLELNGATVALKDIKLIDKFEPYVEIEVSEEITVEGQEGIQVGLPTSSVTKTIKDGEKISAKQTLKEYQVSLYRFKADAPSWLFEPKVDECLKKTLQDQELATVQLQSNPCRIIGMFEAPKIEDIVLLDGQWSLFKGISHKSQLKILERRIVKEVHRILNEKPYLSRVELHHG